MSRRYPDPTLARKANDLFPGCGVVVPGAEESVTSPVNGPIAQGLLRHCPDAIGLAPEFGTVLLPEMLRTLIASNWLMQNPDCDAELRRSISTQTREAFFPSDPAWMQQVWRTASQMIPTVLDQLQRDK